MAGGGGRSLDRPAARGSARSSTAGATVQRKLEVGAANDRFEREADRVASSVMRSDALTAAPPMVSRLVAQRSPARPAGEDAARSENEKALKEVEGAQRIQRKSKLGSEEDANEEPDRRAGAQRSPLQRAVVKANATVTDRSEPRRKEEEEKAATAQRDAESGGGAFAAPAAVESRISSMRGSGSPMPEPTRSFMEDRFGSDFSDVRFHTGASPETAARGLDARAFTVGSDVFFGRGAYRPGSSEGHRLIAHELAHTIQQGGGSTAQTKRIQRNGEAEASAATESVGDPEPEAFYDAGSRGSVDRSPSGGDKVGTITLPAIDLPYIDGVPKGAPAPSKHIAPAAAPGKNPIPVSGPWTFLGGTEKDAASAADRWHQHAVGALTPSLEPAISTYVDQFENAGTILNGNNQETYFLRHRESSVILIGTPQALAGHRVIHNPKWNRSGTRMFFDVDHNQEAMLGGADGWENFWLLEASANRSAGSGIKSRLERRIDRLIDAVPDGFWEPEGLKPNAGEIRSNWRIEFESISRSGNLGRASKYWTRHEIEQGDHLDQLEVMNESQIAREGFLRPGEGQRPNVVNLFFRPSGGGFRRRISLRNLDNPQPLNRNRRNFIRGFDLERIEYTVPSEIKPGESVGKLIGRPFRRRRGSIIRPADESTTVEIPILQSYVLGFGGYMDQSALRAAVRELRIEGASPIEVSDVGVNDNGELFATGDIVATKALFPGLHIPIRIVGDDVFVQFPIPTDRLDFGPVAVTEAGLELGVNAQTGVFLEGFARVAVDRLGSGVLAARVARGGSMLSGDFDFDLDFLQPARAGFTYRLADDSLTLRLEAGVDSERLPGIRGGNVTAEFSRDGVSVNGTLEPSGFLAGSALTVSYAPETGLAIEARDIPLPIERIPGVEGASVSVFARRSAEGEWVFGGGGGARFAIAGVAGGLNVVVDGEVIEIRGSAGFDRGLASGDMSFLATNQELDEEGNPVEGEALDEFRISGTGEATIRFGSVLQATAGITLSPDAQIVIQGELALPPNFEVFPAANYDRQLLHVEPPEFPIWGVSVAGVGIGIFAFVDARLSFDAFVGPGELRDTRLAVTYNIDRPEDTVLDGSASFHVPAGAGFTLDIGGGLRARVATAEISGRVGLDGRLALEAEANAGVNVHWTQQEGLSLDAFAEARARPRFEIGANASVRASVDLLLTEPSYTWGPWRKRLGSFGPELEVGIRFPVAWSEQDGLDLDIGNIQVTRPELDFGDVMKNAFLELV